MIDKRLKARILPVKSLSDADKDRMFELMDIHYENMFKDVFQKDLAEKESVIILYDQSDILQGFSTLKQIKTNAQGKDVLAVFSGDTVVSKDYWGSPKLFQAFGQYCVEILKKAKPRFFYWFLISKGFKTYKILPTFYNKFYPRYDKPTPAFEKQVMDTLAFSKYPNHYDPKKGIISFDGKAAYLKEGISGITQKDLSKPHAKFFIQKNPGWVKGDELVCLISLLPQDLKPSFIRTAGVEI